MKSFLTAQPITPPAQDLSPHTNIEQPAYMKEYMDYMAGLPYLNEKINAQNNEIPEGGLDPISKPSSLDIKPATQDVTKPKIVQAEMLPITGVTAKKIVESIKSLGVDDEDKDYLLKLGKRESSFDPSATQGSFKGLYQFNHDSLKTVKISPKDYAENIMAQHEAALRYKQYNLNILSKYKKYIGEEFKGVKITANGIAAAAHLLGAGTVMDWFEGTAHSIRAKKGYKDALGTSITEYFNLFA